MTLPRIIISCNAKLHAFNLAEQFTKMGCLNKLYTGYATKKAPLISKLFSRIDKEEINTNAISVNWITGAGIKFHNSNAYFYNNLFDYWVARKLRRNKNYNIFIGWSSMSLQSIRQAKKDGKITIVERGSAHILYQNELLKEEYSRFGKTYSIDQRVIEKELKEYEETDFISIPSTFVKNTFLNYGIPEKKLLVNSYGVSDFFTRVIPILDNEKFIIIYLGNLSFQKGLIYLFEALNGLQIDLSKFEVWFIGSIHPEIQEVINNLRKSNWKFYGHINHYKLSELLNQGDIGVFPTIHDVYGMVLLQMLKCGLPVIGTTNSGAADCITNDRNGYIVPIRRSDLILEKIEYLYNHKAKLQQMKLNTSSDFQDGWSWTDYGNRYLEHIAQIFKH